MDFDDLMGLPRARTSVSPILGVVSNLNIAIGRGGVACDGRAKPVRPSRAARRMTNARFPCGRFTFGAGRGLARPRTIFADSELAGAGDHCAAGRASNKNV